MIQSCMKKAVRLAMLTGSMETMALLEAGAAEMSWMHECIVQTADPLQGPHFGSFPMWSNFAMWCYGEFYEAPLP